jgi:hypothetical protein
VNKAKKRRRDKNVKPFRFIFKTKLTWNNRQLALKSQRIKYEHHTEKQQGSELAL